MPDDGSCPDGTPQDGYELADLRQSSERRTAIRVAVGILMARLGVDHEAAVAHLESLASLRGLTIYEAAREATERPLMPRHNGRL
jgi:AmiR/NasT family two-component response regulator